MLILPQKTPKDPFFALFRLKNGVKNELFEGFSEFYGTGCCSERM